jgi:ribosomal protein S18 acetylase RimI-like enzyme
MLYRLYLPTDFPQLYAIEQACFQPPIRFSRRYMHHVLANPNSATWIAEEDGKMTGFAIVDWATEATPTTAYIQTVEVASACRKRGIATELLRRIEASAGTAGAVAISLHVAESNTTAIRLYHAHGYLPQGREEDYYAPGIHALAYSKPLAQPKADG